LRLALVAAYARRGVHLPMILDDVLVNFDAGRAKVAASVLSEFAKEGHQLLVFTCHEHVWRMFKEIKVDSRRLPNRFQEEDDHVLATEPQVLEAPQPEPVVEQVPLPPPQPEPVEIVADALTEMNQSLQEEELPEDSYLPDEEPHQDLILPPPPVKRPVVRKKPKTEPALEVEYSWSE
jgi:hypothetical protein